MVGDDMGDMYPLAAPPAIPTLSFRSKRLRGGELESVAELRQRVHSTARGRPIAPRAREGV